MKLLVKLWSVSVGLTAACSGAMNKASEVTPAIKISLSDIYDQQLSIPQSYRDKYFAELRKLPILKWYDVLLTETTDDVYSVDGNYVGRSHQLLTKSKPYYEYLAKKYGTLGRFWDAFGYDPTKLPSKKDFMVQMTKAIMKNNPENNAFSLLGITASKMSSLPDAPSWDDLKNEANSLPSVIPREEECGVGFDISNPTHWLVKQDTQTAIPFRVSGVDEYRFNQFVKNVEAFQNAVSNTRNARIFHYDASEFGDSGYTVGSTDKDSVTRDAIIYRDVDGNAQRIRLYECKLLHNGLDSNHQSVNFTKYPEWIGKQVISNGRLDNSGIMSQ